MSCEAGFTDNRCNEQTTDNSRAVEAGATLKTAVAILSTISEERTTFSSRDRGRRRRPRLRFTSSRTRDGPEKRQSHQRHRAPRGPKRSRRSGSGDRRRLQRPWLGASSGDASLQRGDRARDGGVMGKRSAFPASPGRLPDAGGSGRTAVAAPRAKHAIHRTVLRRRPSGRTSQARWPRARRRVRPTR